MKELSLRCPGIGRPTRIAFALLALVGAPVGRAFGQSAPDIRAIVEGVVKAYGHPLPYEIVANTTMQLGAVNGAGVVRSKTRLVSQSGNKFRLETENSVEINGVPGGPGDAFPSMVIIGDGTEVWQVSPDFKQYEKTKPRDLETIRKWVAAAEQGMFDVPLALPKQVGNLTFLREESLALDGTSIDCFVLKLDVPDHPESNTLWIEKGRFLIRRTRIEDGPNAGTDGRTVSITTDFRL